MSRDKTPAFDAEAALLRIDKTNFHVAPTFAARKARLLEIVSEREDLVRKEERERSVAFVTAASQERKGSQPMSEEAQAILLGAVPRTKDEDALLSRDGIVSRWNATAPALDQVRCPVQWDKRASVPIGIVVASADPACYRSSRELVLPSRLQFLATSPAAPVWDAWRRFVTFAGTRVVLADPELWLVELECR